MAQGRAIMGGGRRRGKLVFPVSPHLYLLAIHRQEMARRQFHNAAENRPWRDRRPESKNLPNHCRVNLRSNAWLAQDGLDFRSEQQSAVGGLSVKQRPD